MFESKYSKVLTVILVIVIIAVLGLLGFLGYDFYQKYTTTKDASDFVGNYQGDVANSDNTTGNNTTTNTNEDPGLDATPTGNTSSSTSGKRQQYAWVCTGSVVQKAIGELCWYAI